MKVSLVAYTPMPERVVAAAALSTRSERPVNPMELEEEKVSKVLEEVIRRGHLSVLEHASFTFYVEGISRVTSHQLVRHRMASYSQQSQRYVKISEGSFVIPESILKNENARRIFEECVKKCYEAYEEMIALGVPKEDARYVIPQGVVTSIVITMNARELLHFFSLRLCLRAQWEIRELAYKMLKEVKRVAPKIFEHAGPRCKILGYCPEGWEECPLYPRQGVLESNIR